MTLADRLAMTLGKDMQVPEDVWVNLAAAGTCIDVPKETVIKESHRRETSLTFLVRGSGAIVLWSASQWVCVDLCYEDDFLCDYMSLLLRRPTPLEVRTMEASTLFRIPSDTFHRLKLSGVGTSICMHAAEALFIHKQQQQLDLLTATAASRYAAMVERQPDVVLRTPQKYIASFLGITPQSLSRIRAEYRG